MKPDFFNYTDPSQSPETAGASLILQGLDQAAWDTLLNFTEQVRYPAGSPILQAGDTGRTIYIVRSGHVRGQVQAGRRTRQTARLGPGAVFGEMGFFDGAPRSASLWADDDVELLVITQAGLERLWTRQPHLWRALILDLGRVLSTRLRRAESQH